MHSRRKWFGVLVLAMVVGSVLGSLTIASAACNNFSASAAPNPQRPDLAVTINVTGFHDQFFNCIAGQQLDVFVKKPGDADFPALATGQTTATDTNGAASFSFGVTSLYDTYVAEVRWPTNPSVKATTSFSILPGPGFGSFFISPNSGQPANIIAGSSAELGASDIIDDQSKPVHNGTAVGWTLSPGAATPACYLARPTKSFSATTTGVSGSGDTASATKAVPGADLTRAGAYHLDATADSATKHEDDALIIVPASVATVQGVAPAAIRPSQTSALGFLDAADQFGNPSGPTSNIVGAKFTGTLDAPQGADLVETGIAADSCGAGTASLSNPFGTATPVSDTPYGIWTWTVRSEDSGQVSATKSINVQPGPAASIATAFATTDPIIAGNNGTIVANGIKDDLGFAAKNGTPASLTITSPSSVLTNLGTQNVAGVDSGLDSAGVSFTVPGAALTEAGDYSAQVISEGAVKDFLFTVIPDVAVVDMVLSAANITVGAGNTVNVTAVPSVAKSVSLRVTRPDGSNFTLTNTAQEAPLGNGTFNGATSFSLTDAQLDQTGLWGLGALALDEDNVPVGIASGTFTVSPRVLGLALNSVALNPMPPAYADRTVTVSNLPNNAAAARLVVTKPDGSTLTFTNNRPGLPSNTWENGTTMFTIDNLVINQAGTWTLVATALNDDATPLSIGTGTGSFQVKLPVTAGNVSLGSTGSVLVTNAPKPTGSTVVELTVTKPDASTIVVSQTPSAAGAASFPLSAAQLDTVGTYNVIARVKDGATTLVTGTTSFTVSIAPDAITASVNPTFVGSLGGRTTLLAVATKAGVPVANRQLQVFVTNTTLSMGTANFSPKTNGLGQIVIVLIGSHTSLPGHYTVLVRDTAAGGPSATTEFDVVIQL